MITIAIPQKFSEYTIIWFYSNFSDYKKKEGLTRNICYARFFSSEEVRPYYGTGGQRYPSLPNRFHAHTESNL